MTQGRCIHQKFFVQVAKIRSHIHTCVHADSVAAEDVTTGRLPQGFRSPRRRHGNAGVHGTGAPRGCAVRGRGECGDDGRDVGEGEERTSRPATRFCPPTAVEGAVGSSAVMCVM